MALKQFPTFHRCSFQKLFFFVPTCYNVRQNVWPPEKPRRRLQHERMEKTEERLWVLAVSRGARESLEQLTCSLSPYNTGLLAAPQLSADLARSQRVQHSGNYCVAFRPGRCSVIMWIINNCEKKHPSSAICHIILFFLSLTAGIHAVIIFQRHLPMRLEIGFVLYMESKVRAMELMFSG